MENSLPQAYEDSRQAIDNYLAYISRQEEQKGDVSNTLKSIAESVNASGTVAAMAAKESMQSHNTIFGMLKAMNNGQGLLTQMIVVLKRNGGSGSGDGSVLGGALGGVVESVAMVDDIDAILLALGAATLPKFALPAMALFGGLKGASDQDDQNRKQSSEQSHPNSLTNKALEASAEAEKLVNQAYYSLNPAPNPLMNGPGMLQKGVRFKDLPFVQTPGGAFAVVAAFNEANNYLEATGQRAPRTNLYEGFDAEYNDTPDISNLMKYDIIHGIIKQQPQSVQVVAQPASTSVAPKQTINFNIQNDFNGNWQERRGLEDIGEYLARQVKDRLNSGAPLFSGN